MNPTLTTLSDVQRKTSQRIKKQAEALAYWTRQSTAWGALSLLMFGAAWVDPILFPLGALLVVNQYLIARMSLQYVEQLKVLRATADEAVVLHEELGKLYAEVAL